MLKQTIATWTMLILEFLIGHLVLWFAPDNEEGNRLLSWWQDYCIDCINNSKELNAIYLKRKLNRT